MNHSLLKALAFAMIAGTGVTPTGAKNLTYDIYDWTLTVDNASGAIDLMLGDEPVIEHSQAQWSVGGDTLTFADCTGHSVRLADREGLFGKQKTVTIAARKDGGSVSQTINFYPGKAFVTTELTVVSPEEISTRYMAPVAVTESYRLFDRTGNYSVFVPYDNDAWVRYRNTPFGGQMPVSYEVGALVNADTRSALVIGSLEHDTWKTGIQVATDSGCTVDTLVAFGGVATSLTRDIIAHGAVKGKSVKSPLIFVGRYADWRDGMEAFADACAAVAPKIASRGARPFGWNSWGKLQTKINYDNASEVSQFISEHLQNASFADAEGGVCVGLDAFWDFGFKPEQHKQFVEECRRRGQKAGIYYCPFTDWGKNPDATISEMPEYKFKDAYLYGDGKILEFDGAYALDPTHPAVKARIKRQLEEIKDWGYEYVKIDFMAHGAYESDKHFDPAVTTGVQAYSEGMRYIDSIADGKLWINLSIAPLFPANYAHSRRIGCDAWADINNTEYTLNGLTYGWWLDHVYHFNDADHMVLEGVSDGENRARVTSSAITGVYLLGDDMSASGDEGVKKRIVRNLTNPEINRIARECKSFRPVELGTGERAADIFCHPAEGGMYVALFNFGDKAETKRLPLRRLGLSEGIDYAATELWSSDRATFRGDLIVEIPAKDVKVFKISF
ncbi:MAG: alpha-galactosidase [Duncaniella sp.]|nr:alpha-galactosidase [Duncaniella sp.]